MSSIYAAADIGSNTAHLLVAASDGELVMRVDNMNEWIPLGEEVARFGEVPRERIDQLVAALKDFKRVASSRGAKTLYVFGTEALRAASNHQAVLKRIRTETGITVQIIPAQREAELSVRGLCLDTSDVVANLMFEVGGGSAQIARLEDGVIVEEMSLPLGTGRLIAQSGLSNPATPEATTRALEYIDQTLSQCSFQQDAPVAVASGGVARGLWRALHPDGEKSLTHEELTYAAWSSARLTVPRVSERFNVKPKRAGTLLPGALIYGALLSKFGLKNMYLSEFGVREGAVLEMARGVVKGMPL